MPAGRPTKYDDSYPEQARRCCLLWGATDEDLARFFEVNVDTIYEWKKRHPDFSEALKKGKALADANVAERLYNRALGYEYPSEKLMTVSLGGDSGSEVQRHDIMVHVPSDVTACIFWLKNRQPAQWRDKQVQEHELSEELVRGVVNMRSSQEPKP